MTFRCAPVSSISCAMWQGGDVGVGPIGDIERNSACAKIAVSQLPVLCLLQAQYAKRYCALRTVFPSVISGLRKPIAIQAAISFSMNLPE